jgi:hypothetical protein
MAGSITFRLEEAVLHVIRKKQNPEYPKLVRIAPITPSTSLLAFFLILSFLATAQGQNGRPVLRTIHEVNQLTNIEARNAYPVQLDAVVTYSDPEWGLLFIEDATGAIYVNVHGTNTTYAPGSRVKVEAVTSAGDVDTVLVNPHIEFAGKGEMPTAERRSLADLETQKADSRFVVTRGVLRAGDQPWKRICFRIFDGDTSALVVVPQASGPEARRLLGASVRVRGVSGVHIDAKGRVVGTLIFVNQLEDIEVESASTANSNVLAVIVNKDNPLNDLSIAELRRILLGERTTWSGSKKIVLLLPMVGSAERQTALRLVAMDESSYKSHWAEKSGNGESGAAPIAAPASGIAVNLVAETQDAIAVVPLGDVKGTVKILRIDGSLPGNPAYPIH